jgi:hypothetical protein
MNIPIEIYNKIVQDNNLEWIEEHDRIHQTGFPFSESQQLNWWKKNCQIRSAFKEIEKGVEKKKNNNERLGRTIVSWTRISKLSKCDKNTLKHEKRINWVNKKREDILREVEVHNNGDKDKVVNKKNSAEFLISELERRLEESRNEVAKWFLKNKEAEDEIKYFNKILKQKEGVIKERNEKIKEFRERLKIMMKDS